MGQWHIEIRPEQEAGSAVLLPKHVHGGDIVTPVTIQNHAASAGGIVTSFGGPPVGIRTADCMPLVLMTSDSALALHVSRKTLIQDLLGKVPQRIHTAEVTAVFIGPHICAEHFTFEWEGEELKAFREKFPEAVTKTDQIQLSLRDAVQYYLDAWHVPSDIVREDGRCTYEDMPEYSYRRWYHSKTKQLHGLATTVVAY